MAMTALAMPSPLLSPPEPRMSPPAAPGPLREQLRPRWSPGLATATATATATGTGTGGDRDRDGDGGMELQAPFSRFPKFLFPGTHSGLSDPNRTPGGGLQTLGIHRECRSRLPFPISQSRECRSRLPFPISQSRESRSRLPFPFSRPEFPLVESTGSSCRLFPTLIQRAPPGGSRAANGIPNSRFSIFMRKREANEAPGVGPGVDKLGILGAADSSSEAPERRCCPGNSGIVPGFPSRIQSGTSGASRESFFRPSSMDR
ncbi:uncharacterized protein LOC116436528 [Corvus moneduloides]|uniref:uncharacterized protein LOC116436528 n=1 Tax=Corvus moneduloides TaxID=1196302 RepID=UPI001362132A|nr:uncharacterized protein LOC116436528 [Corvus moneduloides]